MNGSWENHLAHAAIALVIGALYALAMGPVGFSVGVLLYWAKEAGEKSKAWDAPRRPWSDWNPLDLRWSRDDRLDLAYPLVACLLAAGAWAVASG